MKQKSNYLMIFIKISFGFIVVSLIYPFIVNYFFSDWSKSGTFGDSYGALNALFSGLALSGVIVTILVQRKELKNQKIELELQREEMKETRKEFLMTRITNIIYQQLDRFEKSVEGISIKHEGLEYTGEEALTILEKNNPYELTSNNEEIELNKTEYLDAIANQLNLYTKNKLSLEIFAYNANNSVEVLKRLIFNTSLSVDELNEFKSIFFSNIGPKKMRFLKQLAEITRRELNNFKDEHYKRYNLKFGEMGLASINARKVKDFFEMNLSLDNFKEEKVKWLNSNK
jgi:hypothetical protein